MVSKGQFVGLDWNRITRLHSQVMTGTQNSLTASRCHIKAYQRCSQPNLQSEYIKDETTTTCCCCFIDNKTVSLKHPHQMLADQSLEASLVPWGLTITALGLQLNYFPRFPYRHVYFLSRASFSPCIQ